MINVEDFNGKVFISFNNPPVNAISKQFLDELLLCIENVSNNKSANSVLFLPDLTVGGEEIHFSAGADLKERALMNDEETIDFILKMRLCFDKIENLSIPTTAMIGGACLGGGLELALCCDFRISIDESIFGLPETTLGIIPGAGGTYRLPKIVGVSNAKEIIYSGKKFSANEALEYGLIDEISRFKFDKDNLKFNNIMTLSENSSKTSISAAKKAINFGLNNSKEDSMKFELEQYKTTLSSPERIEALKKYRKK